mmetsp:Transcript_33615/g.46551  ORF Transcript_33615/g.46551 Transcript_33615/m.46551 type:complete len:602 (-) Transcript_33615:2-1807(-)
MSPSETIQNGELNRSQPSTPTNARTTLLTISPPSSPHSSTSSQITFHPSASPGKVFEWSVARVDPSKYEDPVTSPFSENLTSYGRGYGTDEEVGCRADAGSSCVGLEQHPPPSHHHHHHHRPEHLPKHWFSLRKLWAFCGPGIIMSVAFLDPGNLEGDLITGSSTGYQLLWVLAWATLLGLSFQLLAVRVGVASGGGLAEACHDAMPRHLRIVTWLAVEVAIIACGIQEVLGCAVAFHVLSDGVIPLWAGALLTGLDSFAFLFLEGAGIRILEGFFAVAIGTMAVTFGVLFAEARPPVAEVLHGLVVPRLSAATFSTAVALAGSVVMPHNIYLHSALVLSRNVDRECPARVEEANAYFSIESSCSLFVSFLINVCVVTVFAKDFRGAGSENIGLSNADEYIESEYSTFVKYVWGVGLLAAGQSSTMTGTYAGQFVMQGFLNLQWAPWKRVMVARCVALVPALGVAVVANTNRNLDKTSDWLNIVQSLQLPFAMLPVVALASAPKLMGPHALAPTTKAFFYLLCVLVLTINASLFIEFAAQVSETSRWTAVAFAVFAAVYVFLLSYIVLQLEYHHGNKLATWIMSRIRPLTEDSKLVSALLE